VTGAAAFTVVDTDVLVVGGGLAALRAALAARSTGARVLIAVKRKLGRSGSSANTTGGYAVAMAEFNADDGPQTHYEDTIFGGAFVNDRKLVRALVEEAPQRLQELWKLGAKFRRHEGRYLTSPSGDHRWARIAVPLNSIGTDLTAPLRAAVLASGAEVLENCAVVSLLHDGGRIAGAVCLARDRIAGFVIRAGAVILAAGGAGRMFSLTSNPTDVRGSGYALALKAGARLRDMEFIQFYPWRLIRPFKNTRMPIQSSVFVEGGRLLNRHGERFMERYDPVRKDSAMRDVSARGIFDQIRNGLDVDGGVVLDVTAVSDAAFRLNNPRVVEVLDRQGIDYRNIPLIVAPEAHFFMGGVVIDEHGRSDIAGLYAAGENAGGVHGANRLNSNAVPDTQVFGHRAGISAGCAARTAAAASVDDAVVASWASRLSAISDSSTSVSVDYDALVERLQASVSLGLGIVRTAAGLQRVAEELAAINDANVALRPSTLGELIAATEIEEMCATGVVCANSAQLRTESRGAHFRDDYPQSDPGWIKTITFGPQGFATADIEHGEEDFDAADFAAAAEARSAVVAGTHEHVE
jgi:fumarate reductase (CoM/CoB) subunit A